MALTDQELLGILDNYEELLEAQIDKNNEVEPDKLVDITPIGYLAKIRTIKDSINGTGGGGSGGGDASATNQTTQIALARKTLGDYGVIVTTNTTEVTGTFIGFKVLESAVFSAIILTTSTGTLAGITFSAGFEMALPFTAYTLTSGKIAAYKGA